MTAESFPQTIFSAIEGLLPSGWDRVVIFAEYGEGSRCIEFYVKSKTGPFVKCYDLAGANQDEMYNAFDVVDSTIRSMRSAIPADKLWRVMTMDVDRSGNFNIDYDYLGVGEDLYGWKMEWRRRHLS